MYSEVTATLRQREQELQAATQEYEDQVLQPGVACRGERHGNCSHLGVPYLLCWVSSAREDSS